MALEENFFNELNTAVDAVVAETEEATNDAVIHETAADAGTETVVSEDGDTGTAVTDGGGTATTEESSTGSGDAESDKTAVGAGPSVSSSGTKVSTISDSALTEAVRHGIPIEDARLFPDDAALGRAVAAVRKSIEQFAPKVGAEAEAEEEEEEEDLLAKLPALDPEKFDEDVQGVLNPILEVIKKQSEQLKALREQTKQYHVTVAQTQQAAAQQEISMWFDGQIAKLGDDFKEVLGVGGTEALPPTSTQRAKRDAIANQAAILFAGYNVTGAQAVSRDEVFTQAARIVLADEYTKVREKKLGSDLQKRSKQHIQRAGGQLKGKAETTAAEDAVEELKKMFPKLASN